MYYIYDGSNKIATLAAPLSVVSNQPVFVSDSLSLKRNRQKRSGQRWEVSAAVSPESYNANDLFAFLVSKNATDKIQVSMPQNSGVIAKRSEYIPILVSGNTNSNTIQITGQAGIPKGTFIRFGNHSKIYITLDEKAASSNLATVGIFPNLLSSLVDTPASWYDDVMLDCYFDLDTVFGMSYSDGILMDMGAIKLVEAL